MKESTKEFRKMFPKTAEGYSKMVDAFYYVKYSKLYIYYLKQALNKLKPVPDKMVYPESQLNRDADDIVKVTADYTNPKLTKFETSTYHGKVLTPALARKILTLNTEIYLPSPPETIIPYPLARQIIINNPDHICVVNCPCKSSKEDGCYPRETCIMVGEPIVSFVMEHSQDNPRRITQEQALEIIKSEHEKGHVQTAYFKDAIGDRFYCICNCCKCCCNAMAAHHYAKAPIFSPSGHLRSTDMEKCAGCGTCVESCQFEALSLIGGKASVDVAKCFGCGVCESKCKAGAIKLQLDLSKGEPFDVDIIRDKYMTK